MTEFSACYFCGTTQGVTARPIVPRDRSPAADVGTVSLCSACGDKFESVMDRIPLAEAEEGGADPVDRRSDTDHSAATGTDVTGRSAGSVDENEPSPDSSARGSPDEPEIRADPEAGVDSSPTARTGDADRADEARIDADEDSAESADPDGSGYDGGPETLPSDVSPATVKRVVRLLQNREFPIDRISFVEIAANAYEIDPLEAEAVIEMAIDRGILIESESMLHRPAADESDDSDT